MHATNGVAWLSPNLQLDFCVYAKMQLKGLEVLSLGLPTPDNQASLSRARKLAMHDNSQFLQAVDDIATLAGIRQTRNGTLDAMGLYEATGISPSQYGRWREGRNAPTVQSIEKLAVLARPAGLKEDEVIASLQRAAGIRRDVAKDERLDPRVLISIRHYLHEADPEFRDWIIDKLAGVEELIELRISSDGRNVRRSG